MVNDLDNFKVANINIYRTDSIERYQKDRKPNCGLSNLKGKRIV